MRSPSILVLLAGLLPASLASSAPRVPAVTPPPAVHVGGTYETALPRLPAGVDECELFLLPDDGSGRMIQLTPERETTEGPLRWRMPRIAATHARLVLRAGGRFGETESAPSVPFPVEAAGPRDRAEVLRGDDELAWHFGADHDAGVASLLPPGATTLEAARRLSSAAESPRGPVAETPARARPRARVVSADDDPNPSASNPSRRPLFLPLRN